MDEIESPAHLAGEVLSAVCFVHDYIEFDFDGPVLRALTPVTVTVAGQRWTSPQPGYRDALCSIIGATVSTVELQEGIEIAVRFGTEAELRISLREGASPSGEAAHFLPEPGGALQVW
jgi:hypothetical protein